MRHSCECMGVFPDTGRYPIACVFCAHQPPRVYACRGPAPLHVMKDAWVQGVIDENTLVWGQGLVDWLPAKNIKLLLAMIRTPEGVVMHHQTMHTDKRVRCTPTRTNKHTLRPSTCPDSHPSARTQHSTPTSSTQHPHPSPTPTICLRHLRSAVWGVGEAHVCPEACAEPGAGAAQGAEGPCQPDQAGGVHAVIARTSAQASVARHKHIRPPPAWRSASSGAAGGARQGPAAAPWFVQHGAWCV